MMTNIRTHWTECVGWLRRRLSLLAFIGLAGAISYAIAVESNHSTKARNDLRTAAVRVVISGCDRDNETRSALVAILKSGEEASVRRAKAEGRSVEEARNFYRQAYAKLETVNCVAVGEQFRKASLNGEA